MIYLYQQQDKDIQKMETKVLESKKDFTRIEVEQIFNSTKIDEGCGVIGIDFNDGDLYAFVDEETLELVDMVTKYHNRIEDVPQWQKTMTRNKLVDFYRSK